MGLNVLEILTRIDECLIPDDREVILNYFEMLEKKLKAYFGRKTTATIFNHHNGTVTLLKVMKRMPDDEVVLRMGINIFDLQKKFNKTAILEFLKLGGLEIINRALIDHAEDLFLVDQIPPFKKSILNTGAQAAIEEIESEALSLQLCQKCQETVERAKRVFSSSTVSKIPRSCDRVNRVLLFMNNYPTRASVTVAGLDALIFFAKNADSRDTLHETKLVSSVCDVIPRFEDVPEVMWRCFFCLHVICESKPEILADIVMAGVHDLIPDVYNKTADPKVQQQLLWLLDLIVTNSKSRVRVHISEKCVSFIGDCIRVRSEKIEKAGLSVKEKFKPYMCIVPLSIREFYREIGGKHLEVAPELEIEERKYKERMKFGKKPKYGTVGDTLMVGGEKGLIEEAV